MRKWVRIAVVLILAGLVFLFPQSETEIHKRRCQAAWNRLEGKSITERIKRVYYKVTKTKPTDDRGGENYRERESSREALVELGYLIRQRVWLSNTHPLSVEDIFYKQGLHNAFVWVDITVRRLYTNESNKSVPQCYRPETCQ